MTAPSIQKALDHAHASQARYMAGFQELLRMSSVSTDPAYKAELERCADWIVDEMARIGLKNCRKLPTAGHPVVYGEWLEAGDDQPTALVYAHYDVQPVDPLNLWETPPFEPSVRNGRLYARGSIDDKCGVWANLKALESIFAAEGRLPVNVKLFFEGEEEMGSPNVKPFVVANKDLLRADALVLCDGPFVPQQPVITCALRGIVAAEVTVSGPDHDLHSGTYGGAVHNPVHLVGKIIGSFHDAAGRVQIPGFYNRVRKLDEAERAMLLETWKVTGSRTEAAAGVRRFWAGEMGSFPERTTALPTLDVNGVWGGYQGRGTKTIIPARAGFKVTMRLVADQNPDEVGQMFTDYVLGFTCDTLDIQVQVVEKAYPFTLAVDGPAVEAVQRTFEAALGKRALIARGGGSLPIGGMLQRELGIPITNLGFGSGEYAHSPNEYIEVEHFYLGIDVAIHFYYKLAETLG